MERWGFRAKAQENGYDKEQLVMEQRTNKGAIALKWYWPINAEKGRFRYALVERSTRRVGFTLAIHETQTKVIVYYRN